MWEEKDGRRVWGTGRGERKEDGGSDGFRDGTGNPEQCGGGEMMGGGNRRRAGSGDGWWEAWKRGERRREKGGMDKLEGGWKDGQAEGEAWEREGGVKRCGGGLQGASSNRKYIMGGWHSGADGEECQMNHLVFQLAAKTSRLRL